MAHKQQKNDFISRLIGGVIWAAVLFFVLSWIGRRLLNGTTLLSAIIIFASFYAPWKWFRWNMADFLRKNNYTSRDYTVDSPSQYYLHRANEIYRIMALLTIPFFILCVFLAWFAVR
jgi:ABC-type multidrug transport system fused ATPase/permease subunit